jgi:hypothetical protein
MIRLADSASDDEAAFILYSILLDIYVCTGDSAEAHAVRRERAARYRDNLDVRVADLEALFWVNQQYAEVIARADEILCAASAEPGLYHRCLHLKGLAHLELGEVGNAIEVIKESRYHDTTLVERLIQRRAAPRECRAFLMRALETQRQWRDRGEDVVASIAKTEELLRRLGDGPGE